MTDKRNPADDKTTRESAGENDDKPGAKGLAEKSVTEHHVPGADGPSGAEAEEDNNP